MTLEIVNQRVFCLSSVLHLAAKEAVVDSTANLLRLGADVNSRDSRGNTALHLAVMSTNGYETAKILIESQADINARNIRGETPLRLSIFLNGKATDIIQLLLDNGAKLNHEDADADKKCKCSKEIVHPCRRSMHHLLKCELSLNEPDGNGDTLLHWAIRKRKVEFARLLLQYGADVDFANKQGYTPFHFVFCIEKSILRNGNMRNKTSAAYLFDTVELACMLLERGANGRVKNVYGLTPWYYFLAEAKIFFAIDIEKTSTLFQIYFQQGGEVDASVCGRILLKHIISIKVIDFSGSLPFSEGPILREIAKMFSQDRWLSEINREIIEERLIIKDYFQKCMNELTEMKREIFFRNISLYDVLTVGFEKLFDYFCKVNLIMSFKKIDISIKYPLYSNDLSFKVYHAIYVKRLRKEITAPMSHLLGLNYILAERIVRYFNIKDLHKFRNYIVLSSPKIFKNH